MVSALRSSQLSQPSRAAIRFPFFTQRPTEDGCDLEAMIGWEAGELRRSVWPDLIRVLGALGWEVGAPMAVTSWDAVRGVAIVHVAEDHFMLYDADNAVFYDPWEWEGPALACNRLPLSYLSVRPPSADRTA